MRERETLDQKMSQSEKELILKELENSHKKHDYKTILMTEMEHIGLVYIMVIQIYIWIVLVVPHL